MGSLVCYACCGKEMLGWIREKIVTQESTPRGGRFSACGSITARNGASTCNDPCIPSGDCSIAIGNSSWDNAHTFNSSNRGERLGGEPNTLV
jgi:hypothetical protein